MDNELKKDKRVRNHLPEGNQTTLNSRLACNLKKLLELAHINATELSRRTGVKQPIIYRLLTGENINPKLATLKPIADYFTITVSQLIWEEEIDTAWTGFSSSQHQGWNKVPLLNWGQITRSANGRSITRFVLADQKVSPYAYALSIEDESMEPVFPKNCLVIIEPQQTPVAFDYVVVKIQESEIAIRQFMIIAQTQYLTPLNRKSGTIKELLSEDLILGVVIRTIYERRIISKDGN